MKGILPVLFVLYFSLPVIAQHFKGEIIDIDKQPLTGAVVQIKNTDHYAVSGFDGTYSIKLPAGSYECLVRFIGMESITYKFKIVDGEPHTRDFTMNYASLGLEEVTITSDGGGKTIASARAKERNADNVLNVISSRTIELSPDLDVGSIVQRVSGVSLEVSDASTGSTHAIIRGMSKRYNYTLINGIKIPSPNDKSRSVPLDIFPSDLLDRLEVTKSLVPSMEGDAVGGAVNMVMKDAPERFMVQANAALGFSEMFMEKDFGYFESSAIQNKSPFQLYGPNYSAKPSDFTTKNAELLTKSFAPNITGGVAVGNRFLNNKLGVIVAGSYARMHKGTNSTRFEPDLLSGTSLPKITGMSDREYFSLVTRAGVHSKFDYRLNKNHALKLYAAYVNLDKEEVRDMTDVSILGSNNLLDSERKTFETRFRKTTDQISNITLQGTHELGGFSNLKWSLAYSKARSDRPDELHFVRITNTTLKQGTNSVLIAEDGDNERTWRFNKDQDITAKLDYTINSIDYGLFKSEIMVGGLYRAKERLGFYNSYSFDPSPARQAYGHDWTPDDANVQYSTWEKFEDVQFRVSNPAGSTQNEFNNEFFENQLHGYLQLKVLFINKLQLLGGVRYEVTDWDYDLLAPRPSQVDQAHGSRDHTDLLPSVHLKYAVTEKSNIRASYFYAMIRPSYYEILPYIDQDEDYKERGNPDVKRIKAHNFDLRYENFFKPTDQIMVGLFYKRIIDPIEYARTQINRDWYRMPDNFGVATNYGFEVDFTKYINKIGFKANYTYTKSEITHSKQFKSRRDPNDSNSEIFTTAVMQTRPLQGQSEHIGNASLLFKDQKKGFDAQIALIYTGERIQNVSNFVDNDEWEEALLRLDLSLDKKVGKVTVFLRAKNLLDSPYRVTIKQPLREDNVGFPLQGNVGDDYLVRRDLSGRSLRIGVKYKF